jgi:HlyD family secretion protein
MKPNANDRRRWRRLLPAGLIGVVLVGTGVVWLTRARAFAGGATNVPTFAAQRGPLTISVTESGTIKPQEQISLKSEVEGQTTLIYLIPEGTTVEAGELLAELDASRLQDDRVDQQIRVENANADYIRARENLAVVKNQADSDISKAELTYEFAREDVRKYEEGEYPQQLREAESKITIAREEKERAAEKLQWSRRLYEEKYISQTELQADELSHKRAELEYELAVAAKALLEDYTHKRMLDQLSSDVRQAALALERTKLKASADIVQAEADLKAKEAELEQQKHKLTKIGEQIGKSKIVAPREGLVVYATSTQSGGRRGMTQPLEEGQSVRERQELIYLPSTEAMMAELLVHESSLEKIQVGQPVHVTVDALPGRKFAGRMRFIAPLPDAGSMFMNPDLKVYNTRVFLDGSNPDLRTGMSCRAEILVAQFEDAVYVPVQAVVRVAGRPTVYVRSGRDFVPRAIEIGLDNSSMVHVLSGLAEGEVVSLTPPLDAGATAFTAAVPTERAAPTSAPAPPVPQPAATRPATPAPGPDAASDDERAARRERFQDLSPEERAERRRQWEAMTPEQRQEAMERMREMRGGGGEGRRRERPPDGAQPGRGPGGDAPAEDAERRGRDSPPAGESR